MARFPCAPAAHETRAATPERRCGRDRYGQKATAPSPAARGRGLTVRGDQVASQNAKPKNFCTLNRGLAGWCCFGRDECVAEIHRETSLPADATGELTTRRPFTPQDQRLALCHRGCIISDG